MAGEWRERPLGELTDNFDGMRVPVKGADRRAGPYPYYGASGVVDHVDKNRTLAALRDALLPRLISGELRIADAERFLENAP